MLSVDRAWQRCGAPTAGARYRRRTSLAFVFACASLLAPRAAHAAGAFGPETFVIASGQVPFFERSFSVVDTASAYRLRVRNGVGGHPRVLAAALLLNGNVVVTPLQLNFFVQQFERTVHLKRNNKLALLLVSPPGAAVSVEIFAAGSGDTDPPTIVAIPEPPANAAGWNNQDVVVRFECADSGSGVASCPGPVTVSTEGAGQVVTRTATDNAGNSASASATLNIDKTPPTVTATSSPPPNAGGWNRTDVVVSFACTDALSEVSTCPPDASVTTEGAGQVVARTATDNAGNSASASATLNIDKTPPVIGATSDPPPNAAGWNNDDVTVTFTCAGNEGGTPCPAQVVLATEGAGQVVDGTVADQADNSASASVTLNIDKTPPTLVALLSPAPNQAGWNNTDVTVSFDAQDALSGVASAPTPVMLTAEGPTQAVDGTAVDRADNAATATAFVNIDKTAPVVVLTAPVDGAVRRVPRVEVAGTATEANGLAAVSVNGVNAGTEADFQVEVPLTQEGAQTLTATARDIADNAGSAGVTVVYSAPPVVRITSPANLAAFGTTPITVSGTVDDPAATIRVGIADAPAVVTGNTWTAEGVALREGGNVVTAVATDAQGNSATDSVTLILDTTAPRVFIDSPSDGVTTRATTVAVAGHVQDVVMGTVNSGQAQVRVNGVPAALSNRTFLAPNVTLAPGPNTITATVTDAVGNSDTQTITVVLDATEGARVSVVSGDGQTAGIGETLPQPLVVSVADAGGSPLVGRTVVFSVIENNGALSVAGGAPARNLVATTDAAGQAQAELRLGSRSGAGNSRVEVTSPGIAGAAVFMASALAHPPAKINLDSGNNQKGLVGQPLPRPFVAVVTDEGHNRLGGVAVTFHVVEGDGDFNGEPLVTVASDSDGRAVAVLTLGSSPGVENNVVEASIPGLDTLPTTFTASGLEPGDPAQTRISGVVLDNTGQPVPGVTLRLRGTALATAADAQGQFLLSGVPVGDVHLFVDGSTAQRPGTWPDLEYEMVTVAGANNTLGMPIYLLPLNTGSGIFVDETHGGTVTLPDFPGFSLTVAANSATFPDGTRHGAVTVTVVHLDKVPMVPNFGQQPRFIVTIQPPGVRFDPPAQVTHPNVDGLAPGTKTELYSFDHDAGSFVATGTATVSADGTLMRSDPGTGVVKGGWHCGGNPNVPGSGQAASVRVSATQVVVGVQKRKDVIATGAPLPSGSPAYTWSPPDTTKARFSFQDSSQTHPNKITVEGVAPGNTSTTVTYKCQSGHTATANVTIVVHPRVEIEINSTAAQGDDLTVLTPAQSLPARITLTGGDADINLSIEPAGRASVSPASFHLTSGANATVTITPAVRSASVNDVQLVARIQGDVVESEDFTIVDVTIPAIRAANTPSGVPNRIPPRVDTGVRVVVAPDLAASGQQVRLAGLNTGATNGNFTIDGNATSDLTTTTTVNLRGTVQTAATGGGGGGNAGNLHLVARVRGQDAVQSTGFSVAALPDAVVESFNSAVTTPGYYGLRVNVMVRSDSGTLADLNQNDFSEQVQVNTETGAFIGLGGGQNSGYLPSAAAGYVDSHSTLVAVVTGVGTQVLNQTHIYRDRRLGVNDIPIPNSGFTITRIAFVDTSAGGILRLTTTKAATAVSANGYSSGAGVAGGAMTVTQP